MADFESGFDYDESKGFLKDQLDADDVVSNIDMYLAGFYRDSFTGEWKRSDKIKPLLNARGRQMVSVILATRISNINQYGNNKQDKIDAIRRNLQEDLWSDLCINYENYEFDINNLSIVLNNVDDAIDLFLSRTVRGGFMGWLKGLFNASESYNEKSESKLKGMFG